MGIIDFYLKFDQDGAAGDVDPVGDVTKRQTLTHAVETVDSDREIGDLAVPGFSFGF
ncbi:hypothetical protein [uncultured Nocardioides sp.]|uniref:hypothetical protein n=1 Tax=uncultured Nocardioides sp. TaxID=198441 RepID=UPI002633243E|nr:hypothetical protein [uncultured Nocardioides sp.]